LVRRVPSVNPSGSGAIGVPDDTDAARAAIRRVLEFLRERLAA
jgi:hypothetical protein